MRFRHVAVNNVKLDIEIDYTYFGRPLFCCDHVQNHILVEVRGQWQHGVSVIVKDGSGDWEL